MTYSAVYCSLISKRLQNPLPTEEYGELHHIIPKSEGGDDSSENLVRLSAREHYIAHLLLARIYDDHKMWCAIHRLIHGNKKPYARITSRMYSVIKAQFSKKQSESKRGEKNPNFGKTFSAETRQKMSETRRGEKHPFFGKHHSEETRKRLSESHKGKFAGENSPNFGKHWYTDGTTNVLAKECPAGFTKGRI